MMGCKFHSADAPAGGAAPGVAPPVFVQKPNAGWFVVRKVGSAPKKRSLGVPGLSAVGYELAVEVKEALPRIKAKSFVLLGEKGEGRGAEEFGLQDWLPTEEGGEFVAAFDAKRMSNAKNMVFLGRDKQAEQTWNDCAEFYACIADARKLYAADVATAIGKKPHATFFRLVFDFDRSVYNDDEVCRATGAWLAEVEVPPLVRRTVVAHYLPKPGAKDKVALQEMGGGLLHLAMHLNANRQASSAGVVFQRLDAFFGDPVSGKYSIDPPELSEQERKAVGSVLTAPAANVDRGIQERVREWLSSGAPTTPP
jgi:hypothetical protein